MDNKIDRNQIALVTGASSGMGRCFVRQIAEQYPSLHEIWVIARRRERLEKLSEELPEIKLCIVALDLSDRCSFSALAEKLERERPHIRLLVNAAGMGFHGLVNNQELHRICDMLDVNSRALIAITRICLPYLEKESRVIQLVSGAAFLPQPGFAVYAASKACVLSFSRALREELRPKGIFVTAVCPGPVRTDFFLSDGIALSRVKRIFLAEPDRVVRKALADSAKGRALSVYGLSMKLVRLAGKVLPQGAVIWLESRSGCL